jgi:hypothetical protein
MLSASEQTVSLPIVAFKLPKQRAFNTGGKQLEFSWTFVVIFGCPCDDLNKVCVCSQMLLL